MKIAIITPTFPPYGGGIGAVAAHGAEQLTSHQHDVTVFTPTYEGRERLENQAYKVRYLKPAVTYGNAALLSSLGKELNGFEAVYLHYPFFGAAEPLLLLTKRFKKEGVRYFIHYHMDVVGAGPKKSFFNLHTRWLLPKIIISADRVVVTSFDYARHSNIAPLIESKDDKYIEIPNGVDAAFFQPAARDETLAYRYSIHSDEKVVLFVGGMDKAHYFKGVEFLLEAMSKLRLAEYQWKLLLVGEGDLRPTYRDLAVQLGIDRRTIFTGSVANDQLPAHYNLADVAVLPSIDRSEAFGGVLLEAMACAKPVVASNLPGVRTVATNEIEGLLVEPKNSDDLAKKINHVLQNSEVAGDLGRLGRLKVETDYDWLVVGKQLDQLIRSVQ